MKWISKDLVRNLLPELELDQNKGDAGRVFLVGGSTGMTGAVTLGSLAALRCGSGLVTAGIPRSLNSILEIKLTEAMTLPLAEDSGLLSQDCISDVLRFAENCQAVAIGPGARTGTGTAALVQALIEHYQGILVIDADGINVLAQHQEVLKRKKGNIIITPHPGEMSRLTGLTIDEIQNNREETAKMYAQQYGITVVLKGYHTVIADADELYINPTGNPGMATGGTGDVLTGMVLSFAGRKMLPIHAAVCGVYLHGLAGDLAAKEKTQFCLIASDLIQYLPEAFQRVINE